MSSIVSPENPFASTPSLKIFIMSSSLILPVFFSIIIFPLERILMITSSPSEIPASFGRGITICCDFPSPFLAFLTNFNVILDAIAVKTCYNMFLKFLYFT